MSFIFILAISLNQNWLIIIHVKLSELARVYEPLYKLPVCFSTQQVCVNNILKLYIKTKQINTSYLHTPAFGHSAGAAKSTWLPQAVVFTIHAAE